MKVRAGVRALTSAIAFGLVALVPALAANTGAETRAARVEQSDPSDAVRPLDVKEVDSLADGKRLRFSVVTWHRWRPRAINDRAFVVLNLYTRPGRGPDYRALVRSNGRRMRGVLFRSGAGRRERRIGGFSVWRNDRRSVSLRLPRGKLGLPPGAGYSWYLQTVATSRRCKRVCFDRVPDQGAVAEVLPPLAPNAPGSAALAPTRVGALLH